MVSVLLLGVLGSGHELHFETYFRTYAVDQAVCTGTECWLMLLIIMIELLLRHYRFIFVMMTWWLIDGSCLFLLLFLELIMQILKS